MVAGQVAGRPHASARFGDVHRAMQRHVDDEILAGISSAVLVGRELADLHCVGWADRERQIVLRPDHIFRIFSNTKLVTSCAALLLLEERRFGLDDPIGSYLPQLSKLRVLKPGATSLDDTEPARSPITIRHLLTHSAGLSNGLLNPGTPIFDAYARAGVRSQKGTLADMVQALSTLPLVFHPGCGWEYSMGIDVVGRLIEVLSGQRLDHFLQCRIFDPLGMADTGFVVPPQALDRFVACYAGASLEDPWKPGLTRCNDVPYAGAYLRPFPRQAAGGGLVSTLPDMMALLRGLLPGGPTLLKPQTISLMMSNHLPPGQAIQFPGAACMPGKGFGLAGAVTQTLSPEDPPEASGELEWGGIAGTHWWISPANNLAGIVMAQRQWAFWHPFSLQLKRLVYQAALHGKR